MEMSNLLEKPSFLEGVVVTVEPVPGTGSMREANESPRKEEEDKESLPLDR
jgi:hypothetical protein